MCPFYRWRNRGSGKFSNFLKIKQLDGLGLEFEPRVLKPKSVYFLSHHTAFPKERTPSQVELSTQEAGQSDTWDTVTPEGVEGNLTVYSIGSRGDCSPLSFPNTHSLSLSLTHTHTHSLSLSISLSNQLAVCTEIHRSSQTVLLVKNPPANAGDARDVSSIPGLGRSPGEENGNPFQYSGLENSMDRGAWWVTGHGVKKS